MSATSVDAFLAALIPTWSRFAEGAWGQSRSFGEQWRRAVTTAYRELSDERGFAVALSLTGALDEPSASRARALYALLLLGELPRRRDARFAPENAEPGRYPEVARLLGRVDVPETPAFRARISLAGARWSGADLRGVDLASLDLRGANLARARLDGADLSDSNLSESDLRGASLRGASLEHATLDRANLRGADLDGVILRGATLAGAIVAEASMRGVELTAEQRSVSVSIADDDGFVPVGSPGANT